MRNRGATRSMVERAAAANCGALVLTIDFAVQGRLSSLLGPGDTVAHGEKDGLKFLYAYTPADTSGVVATTTNSIACPVCLIAASCDPCARLAPGAAGGAVLARAAAVSGSPEYAIRAASKTRERFVQAACGLVLRAADPVAMVPVPTPSARIA
jgi:hypothetical protein